MALVRARRPGHPCHQPIVPGVATSDATSGPGSLPQRARIAGQREGLAYLPIAAAVATRDLATGFLESPHCNPSHGAIMNVARKLLPSALVLATGLLACVAAQATPACGSVKFVERRIVEHASGDVESLRAYVHMTSFVYHVGMAEVRDNLDKWRATVDCLDRAAAAAQAGSAAAALP